MAEAGRRGPWRRRPVVESKEAIMAYTLALGMPGLTEWIIIGALGLLIFGKRLPEVGRSLGKGIVEFKKGLKGIDDDIEDQSNKPTVKKIEAKEENNEETKV